MLVRIRPQRLCYFAEYTELSQPERVELLATKCYANEDESCFAVSFQFPGMKVVSFVGFEADFCKAMLSKHKTTNGSFAVAPLEGRPKIHARGLKWLDAYECFSSEGPVPIEPIDPRIRPLEKSEHNLARTITDEPMSVQDDYTVLAWLENGAVCGYVSYSLIAEDLWDVALIFVSPEHRGRGIGAALPKNTA